jgi:ABC-2 type transport system ATP-binding protein
MHEPPIVFLDEPTGGVDPVSRREFWRLIDDLSAHGTTVPVTTHYLDEAERCDRVAIIHAGKLAALGSIAELKSTFADRPILEVRSPDSVGAMSALDRLPFVEKTSLFGTAVHVLRGEANQPGTCARRCPGTGVQPVVASLEDVFLDARSHAAERRMMGVWVALKIGAIADILLFIPLLPLFHERALNFDIAMTLAVEDHDSAESRST